MQRKTIGELGERIAEELLASYGYRIIEKNYRCLLGEIDLIAKDQEDLVFVEVRTKSSSAYGKPAESITKTKQQRLRRLAHHYLLKRQIGEVACRFDVALVELDKNLQTKSIQIIKNAF